MLRWNRNAGSVWSGEEAFYNQAYEGFLKAVSTEMFPMCGMDQTTVDYLLAVMSKHFKRYDTASKCISRILSTSSASKKMKDRAFDLVKRRSSGKLRIPKRKRRQGKTRHQNWQRVRGLQ